MKTYTIVKYKEKEGSLKLNQKRSRLVFEVLPSTTSIEESTTSSTDKASFDLSKLQKVLIRTTLDGERHYIKLIFQEKEEEVDDGNEKRSTEVFEMRSRDDIERLRKDLRRRVKRKKKSKPKRSSEENNDPLSNTSTEQRTTSNDLSAPISPPDEVSHEASHDVEQPLTAATSAFRNAPPAINPEYRADVNTSSMDALPASATNVHLVEQPTQQVTTGPSINPPPPINPDYRADENTPSNDQLIDALPSITAIPVGHNTDFDMDEYIPFATEVILLPYEDDEDEGEDNDEPEIEVTPISERMVTSLRFLTQISERMVTSIRFWNRNPTAKPKRGDRLMDDGWPGCWYTFLYLLACSMIICMAYYFIAENRALENSCKDDDWYDDCHPYYEGLLGLYFLGPAFVSYFAFQHLMCNLCCGCYHCNTNNSHLYLQNVKSSDEVERRLKSYIRYSCLHIVINVHCWHYESHEDKDGNHHTNKVTTFKQNFPVRLASCEDVTEVANGDIDLHEFKLTKIKLQQSVVPDQNFLRRKTQLYEHYKHKDVNCTVTERMPIPDFEPFMLCIAEGSKKPWCLSRAHLAMSHLLLFPALPYRLWMGCITGKVRLEIRKNITTEEPPGCSCLLTDDPLSCSCCRM